MTRLQCFTGYPLSKRLGVFVASMRKSYSHKRFQQKPLKQQFSIQVYGVCTTTSGPDIMVTPHTGYKVIIGVVGTRNGLHVGLSLV